VTPAEFRAWLERRGLSERAAAPLLAAAQQEVNRWARGERKIPRRVARIIELLDRIEELEP
jgi:DNA-binding transcriptional regulator YdaS (Cro superfamily)